MNSVRAVFATMLGTLRFVCFALGLVGGVSTAAENRPNILMVMCDDLGYADVGFSGGTDIKTPQIDALASQGVVCTSGYVTHPFCGPSRMGLLAGRYPHAFGGQYNLPPAHQGIEEFNSLGIPVDEVLISTVLQRAGYFTGLIGKWHLGEAAAYHPNKRGFDDFYGFLGGGHNYFPEQYRAAYERQTKNGKEKINEYLVPLQHNGKETTESEYLTDALSKQAVRFLDEAAGRTSPFFLYVAYNAPHAPMEAKEEDIAAYAHLNDKKRQVVAGMVTAVDRGVGLLVETLRKNKQVENTLVVFLSDNGGKPSLGSSNAPFRGAKGDVWEGGFRVPMFFCWPGTLPAKTFDHPVSALDFYPTFAKLAGAAIPPEKKLDGKNIYTNLKDGSDPRADGMIFAMRHRASYSDVSVRQNQWKAVRFSNQPWRLFDLTTDQSESHDLATSQPARVKDMVAAAEKWSQQHTPPQWFDSRSARDKWVASKMPHFSETFKPVVGAPALPGLAASMKTGSSSPVSTAANSANSPGRKLKKGDSTKSDFIAAEKTKWEAKGWKWNQAKVEEIFLKIDTDGDGIASGKEKTAYWSAASKK